MTLDAEEISRLRQRVAELEAKNAQYRNTIAAHKLTMFDDMKQDAERWRKVAAAYDRYIDPACDDDKYTFMGTVGLIVEAIDD